MEQLSSDHKPEQDLSILRAALEQQIKNKKAKQEQFTAENNVFLDAKHISIEYALASGGTLPQYENLLALYYNGYIAYPPDEILKASECEDYDEFHTLIHPWYEDEVRGEELRKQQLLDEADQKQAAGLLPSVIFKKVKPVSRRKGRITDEDVSGDIKLKRYTRWQVLEQFRSTDDPRSRGLSDDTMLEMVMGIRPKSGTGSSGYPHRLIDIRQGAVSLQAVESKAQELGYFDYVYPEIRQKIHQNILKSAKPVIGLHNDLRLLHRLTIGEVYIDLNHQTLLIGEGSRELVFSKVGNRLPNKYNLGELLVDQSRVIPKTEHHPYKFNAWDKNDCLRYGSWLQQILEPVGQTLSVDLIQRAYRLGLGPGRETLERLFGGKLSFFYKELGVTKGSFPGTHQSLKREDIAKYAQQVAQLNGGKVTQSLIREHTKDLEGTSGITPYIIYKLGGLAIILADENIKLANRPKSLDTCVDMGVKFAEENSGRIPNSDDVERSPALPSLTTIYKHCESIPNFQTMVKRQLTKKGSRNSQAFRAA